MSTIRLGHEAGDRLLMAVTARLTSTLRDADTIGRMGGDEFIVLIDGVELKVAPELVAERLLDVMRQPFELAGAAMPLTVNTSVGIAIGDRASAGELLRDADVALYQAKAAGKNRYEIFHPEMQTEHQRAHRTRVRLALGARAASSSGSSTSPSTTSTTSPSSASRHSCAGTTRPEGSSTPDDFIPILEQTGQIREVGRWVLQAGVRADGRLARPRRHPRRLGQRVGPPTRRRRHRRPHPRRPARQRPRPATSLIIEVTETALMRNVEATARRLQAIKQLGVRIAVDDFGTGYSSLAYLQQFPVDCLKIDRSFTNAITTSPESKALIATLVQLGKDLGLRTLAEGVETTDRWTTSATRTSTKPKASSSPDRSTPRPSKLNSLHQHDPDHTATPEPNRRLVG